MMETKDLYLLHTYHKEFNIDLIFLDKTDVAA